MDAVWVVDDDQSIRWVLERALSKEGYSVKAYSGAREALSAFDLAIAPGGNPPQAIISDVRMPGQSGVQMLARMKARRPALPVIIMTAFTDLDTAVQAFQSGAFEYLPKPFDLSQALDLIRREMAIQEPKTITLPIDFMVRRGVNTKSLSILLSKMKDIKVVVIGDTIVDEYISCDPLGMSEEDPTIVVTPISSKKFIIK